MFQRPGMQAVITPKNKAKKYHQDATKQKQVNYSTVYVP